MIDLAALMLNGAEVPGSGKWNMGLVNANSPFDGCWCL